MFWKKHTEPVPIIKIPSENTTQESSVSEAKDLYQNNERNVHAAKILDADELRQIHEQQKLALKRLEAIQGQLDSVSMKIHNHQELVDLKSRHNEVCTDLYAQNKLLASMRSDEERLQRFEQCETAYRKYHDLITFEQLQQASREHLSETKEKNRLAQAESNAALNQLESARTGVRDALMILNMREDALATGYKSEGSQEAISNEHRYSTELKLRCEEYRQRYIVQRQELRTKIHEMAEKLDKDKTQFAPLDSNRATIENIEVVISLLDNMSEINSANVSLKKEYHRALNQQRALNNRLAALFQEDQNLEHNLATLQAEITMHRDMNHGIDGQGLQVIVMDLRSRKQALLAAMMLWQRISYVWQSAEEQRNRMRILRQENETCLAEIERLKLQVRTMKAEADQKRYDYTLSKGQNVVKLRADLREGVACTVCGAKNHPFHSDTMLDQNKLISEWKDEANHLDIELENTQHQLLSEQLAEATRRGIISTISENILRYDNELKELISKWSEFEYLDASLVGCSMSSMAEARLQIIKGMLDMCKREEMSTTEKLKTFNYHQQAINNIAVEIDIIENKRTDLSASLNETNTGCQVLVDQIERRLNEINELERKYHTIYERLDVMIDISDWHQKWQLSPDNFKALLRDTANKWRNLNNAINHNTKEIEHAKGVIAIIDNIINDIDMIITNIDHRQQALIDFDKNCDNIKKRLFGEIAVSQFHQSAKDKHNKAFELFESSLETALKFVGRSQYLSGQCDYNSEQESELSERTEHYRASLDDWLYQFRINGNPPCRLDEMHELFAETNDWNEIRKQVRQTRVKYELLQAREEELGSRIVALDDNEEIGTLIAKRESLYMQRQSILMDWAKFEKQIETHNEAVKQMENL